MASEPLLEFLVQTLFHMHYILFNLNVSSTMYLYNLPYRKEGACLGEAQFKECGGVIQPFLCFFLINDFVSLSEK